MNTTVLISKLSALEQALSEDTRLPLIRTMLADLKDCAKQVDREIAVSREEIQALSNIIEAARRSSLLRLSTSCPAAMDDEQMDEDPEESRIERCLPVQRGTLVH